jgi:hypothetical protein
MGTEHWNAVVNGATENLSISPNAETPTSAHGKMPDGSIKRFGAIRTFVNGLQSDQMVRLVLRTSWIKPLNVPLYATHANFADQLIPGGHRWTFEGGTKTTWGYEDNASGTLSQKESTFEATADTRYENLYFTIDHAGINDELSPFPITCSDNGYTAESSNAFAAGMPYWNGKQLEFAVFAPHLTTSGEVNHGFFQFWASTAYMDCKWPGNNLSHSTSFTVSVVEADGVQKIETAGANIKDGMFHLWVDDFHYSSPTIKVQAVQTDPAPTPIASSTQISSPTPTPKPSTSASRQTIKCRQIAKPHKLVTLNAPKKTCPKGYNKTNW